MDSVDDHLGVDMIPTVGDVGLLHFRTEASTRFGLAEAEEVLQWAEKIGGGVPKPFLVNLSGTAQVSPKIFRYFSDVLGVKHAVALAMWLIHDCSRAWPCALGCSPARFVRIYTTTSEAMDWHWETREW